MSFSQQSANVFTCGICYARVVHFKLLCGASATDWLAKFASKNCHCTYQIGHY